MRLYDKQTHCFSIGLSTAPVVLVFFSLLPLAASAQGNEGLVGNQKIPLEKPVDDFFELYWQTPIPSQGPVPPSFSAQEQSLSPEACGSCHSDQYKDWKESLHSRAMGPGPWGQIVDFYTSDDPATANICMNCHAPLTEQLAMTPAPEGGYVANPEFNAELQLRGITCAACHVRYHQRYGPPKAEGEQKVKYPADMKNHGGAKRTPYFERAEFCRGCHQFDPADINTILVEGKPLQDTYREWKSSMWGRDGAACQECHMPERRHLWRGIHDHQMVENGVRLVAAIKEDGPGPVRLEVKVTNAAVGHKFPTYVTPKVFIYATFENGKGELLEETRQEAIVGWDAQFIGGRWQEIFDTRIPPGETMAHEFRWPRVPAGATKIRAWMEVHPDHFYHNHFYPVYLQSAGLSPVGRKLIQQALDESGRTPYVLFENAFPLRQLTE